MEQSRTPLLNSTVVFLCQEDCINWGSRRVEMGKPASLKNVFSALYAIRSISHVYHPQVQRLFNQRPPGTTCAAHGMAQGSFSTSEHGVKTWRARNRRTHPFSSRPFVPGQAHFLFLSQSRPGAALSFCCSLTISSLHTAATAAEVAAYACGEPAMQPCSFSIPRTSECRITPFSTMTASKNSIASRLPSLCTKACHRSSPLQPAHTALGRWCLTQPVGRGVEEHFVSLLAGHMRT
eukprot:1158163-Pelagomonas_calceolata.AAC.7